MGSSRRRIADGLHITSHGRNLVVFNVYRWNFGRRRLRRRHRRMATRRGGGSRPVGSLSSRGAHSSGTDASGVFHDGPGGGLGGRTSRQVARGCVRSSTRSRCADARRGGCLASGMVDSAALAPSGALHRATDASGDAGPFNGRAGEGWWCRARVWLEAATSAAVSLNELTFYCVCRFFSDSLPVSLQR